MIILQTNGSRSLARFLFTVACFFLAAFPLLGQNFTSQTTGDPVTENSASRGVNWVDYDSDGDLDLFVSNGLSSGQNNFLYRNSGAPNFTLSKVTTGPVVTDMGKSDGSSWGDYDNDGDLDLFVVNWYNNNNMFYTNNGNGNFTEITNMQPVMDGGLSETCSWDDVDSDGDLDLSVSNSGNSIGAQPNFLYLNNGDGTFAAAFWPPVPGARYTRGVNWADYDDDGDLDLLEVNESNQRNNFYQNQLVQTGSFELVRIESGDIVTDQHASWSGSWADYDNDGDLDLFIANWNNQHNALYRNDGNASFTKITTGIIVNDGGYSACGVWGDYDNDGDLDLAVSNAYGPTALRNFLYRNQLTETGSATFEKISGSPVTDDLGFTYGIGWGDYDNDGDLDLFAARTLNENQTNRFYINESDSAKNWLQVNCVGALSNRSGIGAKVRIKATINGTSTWQRRDIAGQDAYCSQNLRPHFGLGNAAIIDSLIVEWPSGAKSVMENVVAKQIITITEDSASVGIEPGSLPAQGFHLEQNYPNPFNPETSIRFHLPQSEVVTLKIYDTLGKTIRELVSQQTFPAGQHVLSWDGKDHSQIPVSAGVYFYQLQSGEFQQTRKMVLAE